MAKTGTPYCNLKRSWGIEGKVCALRTGSLQVPPRSPCIKILFLTKFQPSTWSLAIPGAIFLFEPKNELPYRCHYPSKVLLDRGSASYVDPGSVGPRFPVKAPPIDGAIQTYNSRVFRHSLFFGSHRNTNPIDCAIQI